MARRAKPEQTEINAPDGKSIAAGPDRDDELHALWLSLCNALDETKAAREDEARIKVLAADALHARGIDHYKADGADLWIEPGSEKVKAKRPDGRPKGRVKKVVAGEDD